MSTSNQDELSQDLVFDLLSSPRRRYVLYYLEEHEEGAVDLRELSEQVAAWENDVEVEELTSQQRKRVYVSLYQTHVPKMADSGVVSYDQESGMVALTDRARVVESHLRTDGDGDPSWQLYYLGLAIIAAVVVLATVLEVGVFAAIEGATVGIVVTLAFGVLALVHLFYRWYRRRTQSFDRIDGQ
jgi:uncharacterized protein YbaR (Trm112 family)